MAIMAMNLAIKNNRKLLPQRDKFKRTLGGYSVSKTTEYNLPKATTKQLSFLRKNLQRDRKIRMLKVVALTIVLFVTLMIVLYFSAGGLRESLWF